MIGSPAEFGEATAFERWALDGLVPLPASRPHSAVKDIENNSVRVTVGTAVARMFAGGVREVRVDLRPLAFGAAWKVLDLLVELALSQSGFRSAKRVTITEKAEQARAASGECPPLTADVELWRTLATTYAATEEVRHSLVHRHAEVDLSSGELTGRDRDGRRLPTISAAQQESFCRAVQRAAQATLTGSLTPRERSDLAWNLDQLSHLHGQPVLGGNEMATAPLGITTARMRGGAVLIDTSAILTELRSNFPDRIAYDADIELPDGRHLLIELEHAPLSEVEVDPTSLPPWAIVWQGPR